MQISAFLIANEVFAVPSLLVEEFFRPLPITRVPGADQRISGLVSVRGRTAVVIDMRRCLGLPPMEGDNLGEMILLETDSGLVPEARSLGLYAFSEPLVLSVDAVSHIHNLSDDAIHPPPPHVNQNFVDGVVETESTYYTMISLQKLVDEILHNTNGMQK